MAGDAAAASGGLSLPKLPELDKRDIEAIAGTLPGKLLGRTAALLALIALALGWLALVDKLLPPWALEFRGTHPRLFNTVYLGLPIAIVALQLTREMYENWRGRRMRVRVIEGEVGDPGYFRLSPYTAADKDRFARIDRMEERVKVWIAQAREPVLFLTGDSGVGKSSLLAAGVAPRLEPEGWIVRLLRGHADPLAAIVNALREPGVVWQAPPKDAEPLALLERAGRQLEREGKRLCLVLDQFEEFLLLPDAADRRPFADLLTHLAAEPLERVRLLLVFRSEYEPQVLELGLPPLRQGETWLKLGAFTEPAARTFLAGSGLKLAEGQIERVLKGAAALEQTRGLYRPIVLNMLGLVLSRYAGMLAADLDPERIIQRHLAESVTRADVRDDAARLLPEMITEAGTKRPRSEDDLAKVTGFRLGNVRHCLLTLNEDGIVRPLGRSSTTWEIAHDFIALQLGLILGRARRPAWRAAMPYAVPSLSALWLVALSGAAWLWPQWNYREAIDELGRFGFWVEGDANEGRRIRSLDLKAGAIEILARRLPAIGNISAISITGDEASATIGTWPPLSALQRLDISGNSALASLRGLPEMPVLNEISIYQNRRLVIPENLGRYLTLQKVVLGGGNVNASLRSLVYIHNSGLSR